MWCSGKQLTRGKALRIRPGDVIEIGKRASQNNTYHVKMCHLSLVSDLSDLASEALPERRHAASEAPVKSKDEMLVSR